MLIVPFTIRFGANGDYKSWSGEGWNHDPDDKEHTWSDHVAKLHIMLKYTKTDLMLQVDVIPVQARGLHQELFVFLNGAFVAFWLVKEPTRKSARIEASLVSPRENLLTFVAPKAICPKDEGMSGDQRTLGLAFRSLSVSTAP